jgi:hypothetical protein
MHVCTDLDIELPTQFDIYHLRGEIDATDKTALEAVLDCDTERIRLEAEIDAIIEEEGGDSDRLQGMHVGMYIWIQVHPYSPLYSITLSTWCSNAIHP